MDLLENVMELMRLATKEVAGTISEDEATALAKLRGSVLEIARVAPMNVYDPTGLME